MSKLAWQKRYDEVGPWFDLLITSIGLIPTAGSALKGVFKWLKRSAGNIDLSALRRLLEPLGINLDRFIRDFPDYITAATAQGKGFIANLANQVTATKNTLRRYIRFDPTGKLSQLISKLDEFSRSLDEILARIDEKFREIGEEIQRQLDELLGGLETANGAPVPGRGQEIDQGPMRMEGSHEGGSRINSNRLDGRSGLNLPQGLTDLQFSDLSTAVRARAAELGLGEDIVVQGSRAAGTARPGSDIDIAIRLSPEEFDNFLNNGSRLSNPNPGSVLEKTRLRAIETGKIQAGEARLSNQRRQLEQLLGIEVDLSVIRAGGPFDNGAQIPLR